MNALKRFLTCQSGATAIEYGFLIGVIAIVIVGALTTMGTGVSSSYQDVSSGFNSGR